MFRAYKFRLFTNANQDRELAIMLETHRRIYNECLSLRTMCWQTLGLSFTKDDAELWFRGQQKTNPFFARINNNSGQLTIRHLDKVFEAFFRRCKAGEKPGYPRFKGRDRFESFTFHGPDKRGKSNGCRLIDGRLYVQHIGRIRIKQHRPLEGRIKTITLKREAGKWYAIFACDLGPITVAPSTLPEIGIDVGLRHFLTTSEGRREPNPRLHKTALPELRRAGRSVSRKKLQGSNRRKAVRKLAKIHARVKNLRREHHYQVAHRLVRRYGMIAVERLNIQGMIRSGWFSRAIQDAAWGGFLVILKCKAESAGVEVVEVDPRGTSQECSSCHQDVRKDLKVRQHVCPHCGLSLDRDHNAALNILARARLARIAPAELNGKGSSARVPRSRARKGKV